MNTLNDTSGPRASSAICTPAQQIETETCSPGLCRQACRWSWSRFRAVLCSVCVFSLVWSFFLFCVWALSRVLSYFVSGLVPVFCLGLLSCLVPYSGMAQTGSASGALDTGTTWTSQAVATRTASGASTNVSIAVSIHITSTVVAAFYYDKYNSSNTMTGSVLNHLSYTVPGMYNQTVSLTLAAGEKIQMVNYGQNGTGGSGTNVVTRTWVYALNHPDEPPAPQTLYKWYNFQNTSSRTMTYKIFKNGDEVGSVTLLPGLSSGPLAYEAEVGDVFNVAAKYDDVTLTDGQWIDLPGSEHTVTAVPDTPLTSDLAIPGNDTDPPASSLITPVTPPSPVPPPASVPGSANNVWRPTSGSAGPEDLLTNAVYREGVDKITEQQKLRDEAAAAEKEAGETALMENAALFTEAWATAKISELTAKGTTAMAGLGTPGSMTASARSLDTAFTIPIGSVNYNVAPWADSSLEVGGQVIKAIITMFIGLALTKFLLDDIQRYMVVLGVVPQARGNTFGGTFGQATAAIAAAIIIFILFATPVLFAAMFDNEILVWGAIFDIVGLIEAAGGAVGGKVADLLWFFFPLTTFAVAVTSAISARVAGLALYLGVASAIRVIVPVLAFGLVLVNSASEAAAEVLVYNRSGVILDVYDRLGAHTEVAAGADDLVEGGIPGGTLRFVRRGSADDTTVEILDGASLAVTADRHSVAHPTSLWALYLFRGFAIGMGIELFGVAYRLFLQLRSSVEHVSL